MCGGKAASSSLFASSLMFTLFSSALLFMFLTTSAFGQAPASSPASSTPDMKVPAIAVDYRADTNRPMPLLNRVGVDTTEQRNDSLREAITQALRTTRTSKRRETR